MKKCYPVPSGVMGYVDGVWMKFSSETDYFEYMEEDNGQENLRR